MKKPISRKLLHLTRSIAISLLGLASHFSSKKNIIISSGFNRFTGYPRDLFEALSNNAEFAKFTYWSHDGPPPLNKLQTSSDKFIRKYSVRWFLTIFNSRCLVFSHDSTDITPIPPPWSIKINLWHGRPIKSIGFDSKVEQRWIELKSRLNIPLPYIEWDYVFAHDAEHVKIISSAWRVSSKKIIRLHPKISRPPKKAESISSREEKYIILYAPTFRDYPYYPELLKNPLLESWLTVNNALLLYKAHPSRGEKIASPHTSNIIDITQEGDLDKLFKKADLLISDYSSIAFDFILTGKPSIFLWDDISQYKLSNDIYLNEDAFNPSSLFMSSTQILSQPIKELLKSPVTPFITHPYKQLDLEQFRKILQAKN
ncbi:CDP-glycerol glycerophosphotransferase [Pseudomonas nitritireducens]|uniref:CDP-glycerol glycerophosphotransferase n=1 Tax=Pseudomonas nitroreducens TaxID=46680 RepID=A0A7W7KP52_PSENT|nr:CDP-glycerol glycerophosphotransferase family protein [Pseudomonas nitritireducens]MBB4866410.1 CDP-glycerol glycerophosphotransferase [Pseudomonas nitritireducens]